MSTATTSNLWMKIVLFLTIGFQPLLAQEASKNETSTTITTENGVQRWRTSTGLTDFEIELRGTIELTDDDKDIKSISNDGYLEINKTVFGSRRTIKIESLGGGKMKKEYFEGRTKMEWDPNGKAWLADVLPDLVHSSTIGAEGRVNRFFRQGGAKAVLNEMDNIESDYVKSHYGKLLMEKPIPSAEVPAVINFFADEISSDYYLCTLLKDSMSKLLVTKEAGDAFFKASESISSDYYRSVVLKEALKKYAASPEQVRLILKSASTMSSDYYLSVVLTSLLEEGEMKEESLSDLVLISKNIGSAYYRSEVLRRALDNTQISKDAVKNVINAVADVDSDYYKTNVINSMAEKAKVAAELQLQLIRILDESVGSDYYAAVSYAKILKNQDLTDEAFKSLVMASGNLSSSNYAADVLQEASKQELTPARIMSILNASANVSSDYYLTVILQAVAPQVKAGSSELKDAYRAAAKNIDSETYYGRALRAIE